MSHPAWLSAALARVSAGPAWEAFLRETRRAAAAAGGAYASLGEAERAGVRRGVGAAVHESAAYAALWREVRVAIDEALAAAAAAGAPAASGVAAQARTLDRITATALEGLQSLAGALGPAAPRAAIGELLLSELAPTVRLAVWRGALDDAPTRHDA